MEVVFKSIYARACMGAGLSVLSGLRAFIPVGFLALYSRFEFRSAPILDGTAFAFLLKSWVIILFLVFAVAELVLDKILLVSTTRDQILQPVKIVLGGMVFAAAMAPDGWVAMAVSGVLGLVIAGLADHVRRSMKPTTRPPKGEVAPLVLVSIYEDLLVLIATLLFVLLPLIGALVACFLGLLYYRLRLKQRRKHKGLRILKG